MKKLMFFIVGLIMLSSVFAADEITQYTDRLNFWDSQAHTITITNNGVEDTLISVTLPAGITYAGGTCPSTGPSVVQCDIPSGSSKNYIVNSNGAAIEYSLTPFVIGTNNSYTGNTVNLLKIKDDEIFHTLVEYGRGRGNYFFDSLGEGLAGSGHSGSGCAYLPNGSMFELNFLHKVLNIKQYFSLANADAQNITFECTYPDNTVVRQHLVSNIVRNSGIWDVDYAISEIGGSWERMGYIGMDFDAGELNTDDTVGVNCTNIVYSLPGAFGDIQVSEDSFNLEVRDRNPFSVLAGSTTGTVGNGSQEVPIVYTITNNEQYTASDVVIEIKAPEYAQFIGTRGELWGTGRDEYRLEKTSIAPGESITVTLIARFDTNNAGPITSLELSDGVSVQFTTCWEINAYNPAKYIQDINVGTNITVDMNTPVEIVDVINLLYNINNSVTTIESTVNVINNTVENIYDISLLINESIANLPYKVWTYYSRNLTYYPPTILQNITSTGSTGAGGGVACRWEAEEHYNESLANGESFTVYGSNNFRVDFNNNFTGTVDSYRSCYRVAPGAASSAGNDILEVYICNNYDGSGSPKNDPGCTLANVHDMQSGIYSADSFQWECAEVLSKEIGDNNVSVFFGCPNCVGTSDGWKVAMDNSVPSTFTYNSTDVGTSWTTESYEALVEWDWCKPIDFGYEVWSYNNRTFTQNVTCQSGTCDISAILEQFNCTDGASTNKLCELVFAINETQYNMYETILIMNGTLVDIDSKTDVINTNVLSIIDSLNCNGTNDSPICDIVVDINSSLNNLYNSVTNINSSVNSLNSTLYLMNQSITQQFNSTYQSIQNITYNIDALNVTIDCDSLTIDPTNETICNAIKRIDENVIAINSTIVKTLDVVNYINGTRWGNVTAYDIYNAIQNQTTLINNRYDTLIESIERMSEFDQELIFLVTDSFGLQQAAKKDVDNGDLQSAATKLREANGRLEEAAMRLIEVQNNVEEPTVQTEELEQANFNWVLLLFLGLAFVGLMLYLFSVPK